MYRYHTYIATHLTRTTLLVAVCLTSIVWLMQALRLLDYIVNQGISVGLFLSLTLLMIPGLLMIILPIALFSGIAFFYHKLKTDSELIALQASGLSTWRLAKPALTVALGAVIIGYILSLYMLPVSYKRFREMQNYLRNNYVSVLLQDGVFTSPVEGLTVFIRERLPDGRMRGVLVHDSRNPQSSITMMADEAQLVETPLGPRFMLQSGNRQELRESKLSFLNFDSYALDLNLYTKNMNERSADPQGMFIPELLAPVPDNERETLKRRGEAHQRLIWPLYSFTLALVSTAILLSGEFNRRARFMRNFAAVGIAAVIIFSAMGLRNLITGNALFVPLAYANAIVPALIAALYLRETFQPQIRVRRIRKEA